AVRVVARPHDVLDPRLAMELHAGPVLDQGLVPLAVPVEARRLGDDRSGPEAVLLEGRVHALEEVRDPADARLDDDETQARVARADAAEDELGDELAHAERRERDERLAHAGGGVEEPLEVHAARALDVKGEWDLRRRDLAPQPLPHGVALVGPALLV